MKKKMTTIADTAKIPGTEYSVSGLLRLAAALNRLEPEYEKKYFFIVGSKKHPPRC